MVDRKAAGGAISGWDIELDPEGTINEGSRPPVFSATQLINKFRKILNELDPKKLEEISKKVDDHILQSGNVHGMEFSDLGEDVIEQVLGLFIAGTPPSSVPLLAVDPALLNIVQDTLYNVTTSTTPYMVTDVNGVLKTMPVGSVVVDYGVDGTPQIPLFGKKSNRFTKSNAQAALASASALTSRIRAYGEGQVSNDIYGLLGPDKSAGSVVNVHEGNGASGQHGLVCHTLASALNTSDILQTPSIFVNAACRYITLKLIDTNGVLNMEQQFVTFDMYTNTVVSQGTDIKATYCRPSATSWVRLGLSAFVEGMSSSVSMAVVGHHVADSLTQIGGSNVHLFSAFGVSHNFGPGLPPFIPTNNNVVAAIYPDLIINTESGMVNKNEGILFMRWNMAQTYGSAVFTDEAFASEPLQVDGEDWISIDVDANTLTYGRSGTVITQDLGDVSGDINTALSYSLAGMKHKSTGVSVSSFSGDLAPVPSDTPVIRIGNLNGYLKEFVVYPKHDSHKACEFLVGS